MRDYSKIIKPTPEHYCAYCGKRMERKRINGRLEDLSAFKRRKYCDRECMKRAFVRKDASGQAVRNSRRSAGMIEYLIKGKEKVCEVCGSTTNIDVHHKDSNPNNNDENNLLLVCRRCHMKIHRQKSVCNLCGKPVKGYGYCNMHYIRWKKFGDPLVYFGKKVNSTFFQKRKGKMFIKTEPDNDGTPTQLTLF